MQAQETQWSLFTGWRGVLVGLGLLIVFAIVGMQAVAAGERYGFFGNDHAARIGLSSHPALAKGWALVDSVEAGGAAAGAGIATGDYIRLANPLLLFANAQPGTVARAQVRHGARIRAVTLVFQRFDPSHDTAAAYLWLTAFGGSLFMVLLGILVVARGWGQPAALALGVGLIGFGSSDTVPIWAMDRSWTTALLCGIILVNALSSGLIAFAPLLYAKYVGPPGRTAWAVVIAIIALVSFALIFGIVTGWEQLPVPRWTSVAGSIVLIIGPVLGCWWAWRGFVDADPAERNRFAALLAAFALGIAGQLVTIIGPAGFDFGGRNSELLFNTINTLIEVVACPLAMAYAVLHHRVVDLSFALNRTVVYGTFSAILLGSFGLIEWGVEHLLPEEWVKASAWIDAGAAVLVYLAFHRVHDVVEQRVEHLFFHQWQANEDNLRRFVASAAHFEDTRALARAFADELAWFGGEARVAMYRRNEGVLDRVAGNWDGAPRHFREDDPAFALMRAERAPLDLIEARTGLPGVLALPMLDHGVLAGLVLLDLKGNGALYRPDEVALLGWAAHEVGLALAALHAGLIETENRLLKSQLKRLGSIIGDRLDHAGG